MYEKKLLRSNLHYKTASNKLSQNNIIKINELIQNKIVCTYIPLKLEININSELKGYKELLTTFLDKENINICKYAIECCQNKNIEILGASSREILNIFQAAKYGCDIITLNDSIIKL